MNKVNRAVLDHANGINVFMVGDHLYADVDYIVTNVGTHTIQFSGSDGYSFAVQIPFVNQDGTPTLAWYAAMQAH